jgi:hypothetical protein
MKVRFTPEAEEQAEAIDSWWRQHRMDARGLFAREPANMAQGILIIHAIWGAPKGRGPKL